MSVFVLGTTTHAEVALPVLPAKDPANGQWFFAEADRELIYVGSEADTPVLSLRKQSVTEGDLTLLIRSDAESLVFESGEERFEVALLANRQAELMLRGDRRRPTLKLDGKELVQHRGRWVRLFIIEEHPTFNIRLVGGSHATVTVRGTEGRPQLRVEPLDGSDTDDDQSDESPPRPRSDEGSPRIDVRAAADATVDQRSVRDEIADPLIGRTIVTPAQVRHHATPADGLAEELREPRWSIHFDAGAHYLSSYYYRGFVRETEGPIVQPYASARLRVFDRRDSPVIQGVDLLVGLQTSHHWSHNVRGPGERWVELNWYGGVGVDFADRWRAELLYVNREDIRTSFRDVHQVELTVRFDDRDPDYAWSLQPYATLSLEYENQSDAGWISRDFSHGRGTYHFDRFYMELGVEPVFELFHLHMDEPVKLSVPMRIGLSLNDYYADTSGRDRTFGYAATGLRLSIPLWEFGADPGRRFLWRLDGGVDLLYLGNSARDVNRALGQSGNEFQIVGHIGLSLDY
ncbi:MAG: hypothetical protein JJU36_14515 [Phycisphaeraceae bacterium]|nr:hypothetical protein [Phycisphaeraceae bacterium]